MSDEIQKCGIPSIQLFKIILLILFHTLSISLFHVCDCCAESLLVCLSSVLISNDLSSKLVICSSNFLWPHFSMQNFSNSSKCSFMTSCQLIINLFSFSL